ncbi:unnamed protein product [Adineta steineri]|uniref:NAD(P)(+)--arginine ADP-ribosyltransferase n=1 Tax=Adineta steineri TaxID=433720 RepID=A0A819QYK7_9BILA|nr:unnamed protein product [Adineta steineri]
MNRFTDIESTPKRLPPIHGYLNRPLVSLSKALEPIASTIDQLDRFSKIAKNECHFPSEHGLTRDESAAVYLYTMEWAENSFYQVINRALRAEDRSSLKPWFAYLKLFNVAIQKLPTVEKNLWRCVPKDIAKNFKKGEEFTWWAISSCTTSLDIIQNFLGKESTLFLIEAKNGKNISSCTKFPTENEVILCPGTRFRVISDPLNQPPMHLIHLKEITDNSEEPSSTATSNREMKGEKKHGKGQMEFANGDKYTGIWVEGTRTGQGVFIYANSDRYESRY